MSDIDNSNTDLKNEQSKKIKKQITEDIIRSTEDKDRILFDDVKKIKKVSKYSKFIFIVVFLIFIGLLVFYIIVLINNKNKTTIQQSTTSTSTETNYFFYNHTGFSNLNVFGSCYSIPVINEQDQLIVDYDLAIKKDCIDTNFITGIEATRVCENENGCIDYNNTRVTKGDRVDYNLDSAFITSLPTCDLKSCKGYLGRIISFINKIPYCMTITPLEDNSQVYDLENTAFIQCDINNRNQLLFIENINNEDKDPDFLIKIYSRSAQKYLYIDSSGGLKLTDDPKFNKFWFYTPNVQINQTTMIPSQLVFIDYNKIREYSNYESNVTSQYFIDYSPIFNNENSLINIKLDQPYYDILTNLYSLSPSGYLSSRQYVQFCYIGGIGNKSCRSEITVIRESDFISQTENNTLKYKYTGTKNE